jgi:hypothetical protein
MKQVPDSSGSRSVPFCSDFIGDFCIPTILGGFVIVPTHVEVVLRLESRGMRHCFLVLVLTAFCSSFASALEWDLSVPGAKARLGFGGGFFVGTWSELRLEVAGAGAYHLNLNTVSGRFRDGFKPLTASLSIPEGSGVRVQTLEIPLTNHVVRLTLAGEAGSKTVTLEPFDTAMAIGVTDGVTGARGNSFEIAPEDLPTNPALLLGVPEVIVKNDAVLPASLLAALAAGSRVFLKPESQLLKNLQGTLGLGRLERDPTSTSLPANINLEGLARSVAPAVGVPAQRQVLLGWWAVGGFVVGLGIFSARRLERSFVIGSACGMFLFGVIGFWAFAPQASNTENTARVLIGSRGWGLKMTVVSRMDLQTSLVHLPLGVKSLASESLEYQTDSTLLKTLAWQKHSYLMPPTVGAVPLRVVNQRIENLGDKNFSEIYVVGFGVQEPIAPGSSAKPVETGFASQNNFEALPKGSVVGSVKGTETEYVIALPEDKP